MPFSLITDYIFSYEFHSLAKRMCNWLTVRAVRWIGMMYTVSGGLLTLAQSASYKIYQLGK